MAENAPEQLGKIGPVFEVAKHKEIGGQHSSNKTFFTAHRLCLDGLFFVLGYARSLSPRGGIDIQLCQLQAAEPDRQRSEKQKNKALPTTGGKKQQAQPQQADPLAAAENSII